MKQSIRQLGLSAISGTDRSLRGGLIRSATAAVEPLYMQLMRVRNAAFDRGWKKVHDLGRPTISVGNITTGGTGKTPVVKWLAERLIAGGKQPAVLMRGYASASGESGDEALVLRQLPGLWVQEDPSRVEGAASVLRNHPQTDVFILDDGFQHRRAKRDFNLVLISAPQPFGFGHVLPRGLLREPLEGLKRADAFLVTRCGLVDDSQVVEIDRQLKTVHPSVRVYHCDHHLAGVWMPGEQKNVPIELLVGRKVFVTAGIADPASLARQLSDVKCEIVGSHWFDDHHRFGDGEIDAVLQSAIRAHAEVLLMTEKDWVKVKAKTSTIPIGVIKLEIRFREMDETGLLEQIEKKLGAG